MTTTDLASAAPVARSLRSGNARFTVLTPAIVRLEFDPTGVFEDRPSMAFPDRSAGIGVLDLGIRTLGGEPGSADTFSESGGTIETEDLVLRYEPAASTDGGFTAESLSIRLKNDPRSTWTPCPGSLASCASPIA